MRDVSYCVLSMNAAGTVPRPQGNSGSAGGHCIEDLESCNFPTDARPRIGRIRRHGNCKGINAAVLVGLGIPETCYQEQEISNENCTNCLAHRTTARPNHQPFEYFAEKAEGHAPSADWQVDAAPQL